WNRVGAFLDTLCRPRMAQPASGYPVSTNRRITMYSTLCFLAPYLHGATIPTPAWNRDYDLALRRAKAADKPLAVFIAPGKDGWKRVCKEGELNPAVTRLLTDEYVCLFVDAASPKEKALAGSFEADSLPLLVLSDRSTAWQAYRHSGTL